MRRSALDLLDPTRKCLIVSLKQHGRASAETLADSSFLSVGAARQHLQALVDQGFVCFEAERKGPGRPRHLYQLTSEGDSLFPQSYGAALDIVLDAVGEEGPEVRDRVIERFSQARFKRIVAAVDATPGDRVEAATQVLYNGGFLVTVSPDEGGTLVTLHHCPIVDIARRHPGICQGEAAALAAAFGGEVAERRLHRLSGDTVCSYLVGPGPRI